jgi:HEAT repeat protein
MVAKKLIYNLAILDKEEAQMRYSSIARFAAVAVLLVGFLGCATGDDPMVAKAKEVYVQLMDQDAEYAAYGVSIASYKDSPFLRQLLMDLMSSEHYSTALVAVTEVQEDPPADAMQVLQSVFAEKRGALKLQAAISLARLGDEQALEWLSDQMAEGKALLNSPAVLLLRDTGKAEILRPQLEKLMKSENLASRNEAYSVLGMIAEPWATELLVKGLDKEHGEDRQQAIAALGASGDPDVAKRISRFVSTQGLVFTTLEALGALGNPDSASVVRRKIEHDEPLVRVWAAISLWKLGEGDTASAVLEPLLNDEDVVVRRLLAEKLEVVDDAKAVEWLGMLAEDQDQSVRLNAVRSLALRATAADEPMLLAASKDEDYEVATAALSGLAAVGGEAAMTELGALLDSENPYIALSAANAVLAIGGRRQPASGG